MKCKAVNDEITHVFQIKTFDSTNNENSSQSVIVFIIYLLPRNFKLGIGLRCIFYIMVFIKVPYYMFIC